MNRYFQGPRDLDALSLDMFVEEIGRGRALDPEDDSAPRQRRADDRRKGLKYGGTGHHVPRAGGAR
jgi:hypothetical protein